MRRIAICLATLFLLLPAWASEREGSITVGEFIQQLAGTKGLTSTDAQTAVQALASLGVPLPETLVYDDRLTEGAVVRVSRATGLRVTTSWPDRPFDAPQVTRFFLSFREELSERVGRLKADDVGTVSLRGFGDPQGKAGPPFDPFRLVCGPRSKSHLPPCGAKGIRTPTEPE